MIPSTEVHIATLPGALCSSQASQPAAKTKPANQTSSSATKQEPAATTSLVTTAGFVNPSLDPAIANFRLRISSPAIDQAILLQFNDIEGRPRGALPDAGAYEASTGEGALDATPSSTVAEKQQPDQ